MESITSMVVCIYAQEGHSSGRVGGAGVWGGGVESNISTMFWLCLRSRRGYWLFDLTLALAIPTIVVERQCHSSWGWALV